MRFNETLKALLGSFLLVCLFVFCLWALSGGGNRKERADAGVVDQVLHLANGTEPEDIDPHITTGVSEHFIQLALIEGLVAEDPKDLHPVPGVAKSWDISEDGTVYTFYLRDAKWSNSEPITAEDFVLSYKRALAPRLANEYASMLFHAVNAREYYNGEITDFDQVGFKALDDKTLEIRLNYSTPFFLSLLNHHSWYPVHVPTILKYGAMDDRRNTWSRPGNFVGNGPFVLDEWKINNVLTVRKNTNYWDVDNVRLEQIYFYPIESLDTEERAFRAGQIHKTNKLPLSKIPKYVEEDAKRPPGEKLLLNTPYLGTYHYMFNTSLPGLKDPRVRKALNLAIDRESIVKNVTKGGEAPAFSFVPPNCAGYNSIHRLDYNIAEAKRLLAEAGYPNGEGFPEYSILYNTLESHKTIAEAVQDMWKKNLGINCKLENQEWKVYLNSKTEGDFEMVRFGWIGDYVDPNTFLELYTKESGNNNSNWSSDEYDRLLIKAGKENDQTKRYEIMQQAEKILLEELPIMPIYYYMSTYLVDPRVKGWHPTILDHHPYKHVYLEE
jgi:oligopeptide transport system substrate-binding protein